jgi:hypothetical protein
MKDNRLIGFIGISVSLIFIIISVFYLFFFLLYAIPILILSLYILFNKKEDKIEQIKKR